MFINFVFFTFGCVYYCMWLCTYMYVCVYLCLCVCVCVWKICHVHSISNVCYCSNWQPLQCISF